MHQTIKVPINGFYYYLHTYMLKDRVYVAFKYHKRLVAEVKDMRGSKWHPNADEVPPEVRQTLKCGKCWSVDLCQRNVVNFGILGGDDPFQFYLEPWEPIPVIKRSNGLVPYPHQCNMAGHQLAHRRVNTAAEMGCGKTLAAIMTMELADNPHDREFWYISTKSGLLATMLELKFWQSRKIPMLFTYEELVRTLKNRPDIRPPQLIIFDESAAIKNITAQRTQAAMFIADRMRREVEGPYIIEMCGAPQPQSPVDWWSQIEIIAPGFLREGDPNKLARRIAFTEPGVGGMYLKRISWRDNTNKCDVCGELREAHHDIVTHRWTPSKDEVAHLGRRLRGPVHTVRKADVLKWLPEKIYREIEIKPSPAMLRAAKIIAGRSIPVIQKLTLLRQLSDGFRYEMQDSGQTKLCGTCQGLGTIQDYNPDEDAIMDMECPECKGKLAVNVEQRVAVRSACPKDEILKDLLDECEETGRIVTYAGFTGSVDRAVDVLIAKGWDVIRADGRGWHTYGPQQGLLAKRNLLETFQRNKDEFPRLGFVAQAGAAGTGLTLTASEMIVYYSNDFDANHRIQSEDRIHRPGCTGALIVDLIHLETDRTVLNALKGKRRMQDLVLDASIFEEAA